MQTVNLLMLMCIMSIWYKNRTNTKRQRESWRCELVSSGDSWPNRRTRIQIPGNRKPLTSEMATGSERETK